MKNILITGASGDIGSAIATEYAKNGFNIAIHYNSNKESAENLKSQIEKAYNVKVEIFGADMKNTGEIKALAQAVLQKFGFIDILINNAGISHTGLFQLCSDEKAKEVFDVNIMSMITLTKEILPSMISEHKGKIINISSMWGVCGASCEVHYSASKAAVIGFTKALAKEVGPSGITVNCICPGFIDTKMNNHLNEDDIKDIVESTPLMRKGTGEDVAYLCEFLSSEKASFITGQVISVDGGFSV